MIKSKVALWMITSLLFFCLLISAPSNALASCEEDCEIPRSCKEYLECKVAHLECLAACKQKEAWELSAQSSEKQIAATERMAEVLEKTFEVAEKITLLLDKLVTKVVQNNALETPQAPQEENPSLPTPP